MFKRRVKVPKGRSQVVFTHTARRVHPMNLPHTISRGGFRL